MHNAAFIIYLQNNVDLFKRPRPMVTGVILSSGNLYKFSENFLVFLYKPHKSRNYEHFVNKQEYLLTFL